MKKVIHILILALVLGFAGVSLAQSSLTVEQGSFASGNSSAVDQDPFALQLARISLLEKSLSGTLFKTKAFQSLRDFSKPIADEAKGRDNPFAPIDF